MLLFTHILCLIIALYPLPLHSKTKDITVASDATWPPLEYLNENKKVIGYSTDYITAVAKEAGLNIKIRNTAWDGIFVALNTDQVNIIASSVTITNKRIQKIVDFSEPYYEIHQAIIVPIDSSIHSINDLTGKKIGGQIGTTGLIETIPNANIKAIIKTYDEIGLAFEDLSNGSIDAIICDEPVAQFYRTQQSEYNKKFKISFITPESEYYGFAVKKGNTMLLDKINMGIKAVKEKGIDKILIKKWIKTQ